MVRLGVLIKKEVEKDMNFNEKCSICGNYTVKEIVLRYFDFSGLKTVRKKMCTSCHAVFDLKNKLEDIIWNKEAPQA